jgi:hypothetical protein
MLRLLIKLLALWRKQSQILAGLNMEISRVKVWLIFLDLEVAAALHVYGK